MIRNKSGCHPGKFRQPWSGRCRVNIFSVFFNLMSYYSSQIAVLVRQSAKVWFSWTTSQRWWYLLFVLGRSYFEGVVHIEENAFASTLNHVTKVVQHMNGLILLIFIFVTLKVTFIERMTMGNGNVCVLKQFFFHFRCLVPVALTNKNR